MTAPRILVLLGSDRPIPGDRGRHWRAVDGEPAYRREFFVDDSAQVDIGAYGPEVTVWVGERMDGRADAGDYRQAQAFLAVGQEPAPGHEAEFNAWMDDEHVPGLAAAPGTFAGHRYRALVGEPAFFAVYHLRDLDVNKTSEWRSVGASPLSLAMKPYSRKRIRGLYTAG